MINKTQQQQQQQKEEEEENFNNLQRKQKMNQLIVRSNVMNEDRGNKTTNTQQPKIPHSLN